MSKNENTGRVINKSNFRWSEKIMHFAVKFQGFSGGSVAKKPPANGGDMGSIPDLGRSHMPQSNHTCSCNHWACALERSYGSPCSLGSTPCNKRRHRTRPRRHEEEQPCSQQLEKAHSQQRSSTTEFQTFRKHSPAHHLFITTCPRGAACPPGTARPCGTDTAQTLVSRSSQSSWPDTNIKASFNIQSPFLSSLKRHYHWKAQRLVFEL